jgi:hypothetical protein
LEFPRCGHPRGRVAINLEAVINIREESILGELKGCRITTKELSIDLLAAETYGASASYSDCVLVAGSIKEFFDRIEAAQAQCGN